MRWSSSDPSVATSSVTTACSAPGRSTASTATIAPAPAPALSPHCLTPGRTLVPRAGFGPRVCGDDGECRGFLRPSLDPPTPAQFLDREVETPGSNGRRSPASIRSATAGRRVGRGAETGTGVGVSGGAVRHPTQRGGVRHGDGIVGDRHRPRAAAAAVARSARAAGAEHRQDREGGAQHDHDDADGEQDECNTTSRRSACDRGRTGGAMHGLRCGARFLSPWSLRDPRAESREPRSEVRTGSARCGRRRPVTPRRGPVPQGRCGTGPGSPHSACDPSGTVRMHLSRGEG
jgi:hypothetical protein